jgi:hypothetical protein
MSEESANPSGLPGRNRPALSDLSKETTEGDLWNLDNDSNAPPLTQPARPPQPRVSSPSDVDPLVTKLPYEKPEPSATPPSPKASLPPRPRGRMPAQQRPDHAPPLGHSTLRGSRNDEIGDLEEPAPQAAPKPAAPPAPQPAPEPTLHPTPEPTPQTAPEPIPETEDQVLPAAATAAKPTEEKAQPHPESKSERAPARPFFGRFERREAVGLAAFAVVLSLVAIWVLALFFSRLEFKSEFIEMPNFPTSGQHASVAAAETFWREPIRDGAGRDFARREAKMIPVLELTLESPRSPGGALLVIFRNGEGEPIGDSIRRSFRSGTFDASGSSAMSFPATDGFVEEGAYQAYRTGRGRPWVAEVLEGPSVDAPADTFKPLATIPVSPLRR